jgi:hypothetical protein
MGAGQLAACLYGLIQEVFPPLVDGPQPVVLAEPVTTQPGGGLLAWLHIAVPLTGCRIV